ncbi:low molecular weight protein-tyrosine-phosphatase [Rhizobium sp. PAMB 3182]
MTACNVLFVCLGNICRSPLAEGIFMKTIEEAGCSARFAADSAGTGAWHQGDPPDSRSIAVARKHGIDISNQRARQVRPEDFETFDLILAMDRNNLDHLARIAPATPRLGIHRFSDYALGQPSDIPDPYYGGADGFETVYSMLLTGCASLVEKLGNRS